MPKPPFDLFAVVPPGLEPVAAAELAATGQEVEPVHGGLAWSTGWDGLMGVHLSSRVVSRVLIRVARFGARALGELERKCSQVDWDAWIPSERRAAGMPPLPVEVSCRKSRLYHERAVRERVWRALGWEDVVAHSGPEQETGPWRLHVRVHRDAVTLSLDTTGPHLHRRGYRRLAGAAPLRETLAAAALQSSGWTPDRALLDPFAGSGTIPIEGALIARRIPPALSRASREPLAFPFLAWPDCPQGRWADLVERATDRILPACPAPIVASDRDGRGLEALRANALAAGVEGDLEVRQASMTESSLAESRRGPGSSSPAGWIVTNPPYGGRLGERSQLRSLYRALGSLLSGAWHDWGFCAWMSDPVLVGALRRELGHRNGGELTPVLKTRNGGIPVTLLRRDAPPPPGPPTDP